jgi:cell division topological specificity factor
MLTNWLERIFGKSEGDSPNSRDRVKQRLQLILAHDRVALTPQMLEEMRREIMAVVSKYVEIDQDSMEISLESDRRATVMIANLPIRAIVESEEIDLAGEFEQLEISAIAIEQSSEIQNPESQNSEIESKSEGVEFQLDKTEENESQKLPEKSNQTSELTSNQ